MPLRLPPIMPRGKKERRKVELLGGLGVALVSALVVSVFLASSVDRYLVASNQYAAVIAAVLVDLTNGDRTQNSLRTLTMNPVLVAAAQAKADDMAAKSYFAHVSPEGIDPWHWFKQAGYAFVYAGENLAVDFSDSSDVNSAWMNSPSHRQNILNPQFTEIGIATAEGMFQGRPTTFVVQAFGTPSPSGAQGAVTEVSIPASPSETALATSVPTVLGEAAQNPAVISPKPVQTIAKAPAPAPKEVEVLGTNVGESSPQPPRQEAAANATPDYAPLWAHIATAPRSMLQYSYWLIALFVVLGLGFATGFEIRAHHTRKAVAAGILLSFILVMFIAANTFVFTTPTLTPQAITAAAGAL